MRKITAIAATVISFVVIAVYLLVFNVRTASQIGEFMGVRVYSDFSLEQMANTEENGLVHLYMGRRLPANSHQTGVSEVYISPGKMAKFKIDSDRIIVEVFPNEDV